MSNDNEVLHIDFNNTEDNATYVSEEFKELNRAEIDMNKLCDNTYETNPLKESSEIYTDIKCISNVDKQGRTIYRFDDKTQVKQPLVIVIFKNSIEKLVSVNQQVLSLKNFLSIKEMEEQVDDLNVNKKCMNEIRSIPLANSGNVKVVSENGNKYTFKNTTVPLIMMAMSILTEKYVTI